MFAVLLGKCGRKGGAFRVRVPAASSEARLHRHRVDRRRASRSSKHEGPRPLDLLQDAGGLAGLGRLGTHSSRHCRGAPIASFCGGIAAGALRDMGAVLRAHALRVCSALGRVQCGGPAAGGPHRAHCVLVPRSNICGRSSAGPPSSRARPRLAEGTSRTRSSGRRWIPTSTSASSTWTFAGSPPVRSSRACLVAKIVRGRSSFGGEIIPAS